MDVGTNRAVYEFGDFRLDASRRVLHARGEPRHLAISPHAFDTLLYFVEHAGELLDKDRLLAALWPGAVVDENSLSQVISSIRRVLGEARGDNRYIATVPGRGYRFVADVSRVAWPVAQPSPDATVAVLPFENLGEPGSDDHVARAVAENILHRVATIPGVAVVAQTSSFGSSLRDSDAREIGRRLNARYLVEGSLQRDRGRLRVTAQLVDAFQGVQLWSLRFDCAADDLFAAEDEIAQPVAEALAASLNARTRPPGR